MTDRIDLLAAYFTLAGDVYPGGPIEVSPWPFEERVAAASDAGFRGFGLYYPDLTATSERLGLETMRSILESHGIEHVEIEFLGDWFADGERRAVSNRCRADLLNAAEALGARHIKVGGDLGGQVWPTDRMIREFEGLCRDAGRVGTRIAIELMPFSSLATIDDGLEIVESVDAPNAGLCLDIWHVVRGGISFDQVREVPGRLITSVELNDGPGAATGSLWDDAVENRTFCGDGELAVPEFISAIASTGYDGPYGVEIMGIEYRSRPLLESAHRVFETTMAQFGRADAAEKD